MATSRPAIPAVRSTSWSDGAYGWWGDLPGFGKTAAHGTNMVYFGNWLTTASGAISIAAIGEISGITGFTHAEGYDPVVLGQTVGGLTAGASYLLDFWVTGEGNGGPGGHTGVFGLEIDGDTRHLLLPAGSNSFGLDQRYQVALTADATSMDISFHNWGHTTNLGGFATEIVLDDVILNADARVPEPGLLMLMKKRGLQVKGLAENGACRKWLIVADFRDVHCIQAPREPSILAG